MAVLHHRKLVIDAMVNATEVCRPLCDKGICSTQCKLFCPHTCVSYLFSPPPPPPEAALSRADGSHRASAFLSVTIALLAASFLLVCGYALYARYYGAARQRGGDGDPSLPEGDRITREFLDEEHGATVDHHVWFIRTVGLDPSVIGSITAVRYKKDDGLVDGTDCSVCLSEFQEDESLRLLPKCSHAFHVACIDTWLRSHTNCPMCRAPIMVKALPASETVSEGETLAPAISRSASESGESSGGADSTAASSEDRVEAGPGSASLDCLEDKEASEAGDEKRVRDEKKLQRLRSGGSLRSNSGRSNSMKRSRSCNGKFVLRRPVRITDSILPLRSV